MSESTAVVVDTHTLVWYVDGDARLSPPARQALDAASEADLPIIVSPISLLEVSYLADRGKVASGTGERLREVLDEPDSAFEVYPIDLAVILAAIDAPWSSRCRWWATSPADSCSASRCTGARRPRSWLGR